MGGVDLLAKAEEQEKLLQESNNELEERRRRAEQLRKELDEKEARIDQLSIVGSVKRTIKQILTTCLILHLMSACVCGRDVW